MNPIVSRKRAYDTPDFQAMESKLLTLEKRSRDLVGELESLAQEIGERENRGAPIKRLLKRHDRLRERYWVVESRCRALRAHLPERPATMDDF
jgi:hypothetical protein